MANKLTELAEHLLSFAIQFASVVQKVSDRLNHFAIDIELQLVMNCVSNSNG
jgi:hypothetical protein